MLRSANPLFRELNALEASTQRRPSVSSLSYYSSQTQCTIDSRADFCPAQSCLEPVTSITSCFNMLNAAFPINYRQTSPIPMGRTPGFLSNAISLLASNASSPDGST